MTFLCVCCHSTQAFLRSLMEELYIYIMKYECTFRYIIQASNCSSGCWLTNVQNKNRWVEKRVWYEKFWCLSDLEKFWREKGQLKPLGFGLLSGFSGLSGLQGWLDFAQPEKKPSGFFQNSYFKIALIN